ncbi:MAG: hypothetical protein JSW59_00295 [Phycisphaerales bacterium]|nr:MAG: hypothetical protein JSW59_00295 [Phycisphaerales bacterium]
MTVKNIVTFLITSVCVLLVTASCSSTHVHHPPGRGIGHGPPPHAPAHGHRRKHVAGVEVVFDTGRGLYVVIGYPDHYYHDGYFYRLTGGVWEMSLKIDGGWARVSGKPLPPGLRKKGNGYSNGKSKNQGISAAKGKGKQKRR